MTYLDELNAKIATKEAARDEKKSLARKMGRRNRYSAAYREQAAKLDEDVRALKAQRDLELVDAHDDSGVVGHARTLPPLNEATGRPVEMAEARGKAPGISHARRFESGLSSNPSRAVAS